MRRRRALLVSLSLLLGAVAVLGYVRWRATRVPDAVSVPGPAAGPLVPASGGVLLGAFRPDATGREGFAPLERLLGRPIVLDLRFHRLRDPFPTAAERRSAARGRILVETWMPDAPSLAAIARGEADDVIAARGRDLAALGSPVMVRFGHEMNGDWYRWAGDPAAYVAAWRHVREVVRAAGATDVVWVWSPNWRSIPDGSPGAEAYWPGDDQVDWVGIDGYAPTRGLLDLLLPPPSLARLVTPLYDRYARTKPIMVAETGTSLTGGDAAAWAEAAGRTVRRLPGIAALVLFDARGRRDWRIDADPGRSRGWRRALAGLRLATP